MGTSNDIGTRILSLDLRSLAVMRIFLAALALYDLYRRGSQITEYYSDQGVAPRDLITSQYWNPRWWSVHLVSGETSGQTILFVLHAAVALLLLIGWRTRLASVLTFLLTVSLHNRNPLVLDGGDRLLLILLFWGLFLPWGSRFSIDSRGTVGDSHTAVTPGGSGYLFQIVSLYLMAAFWKLHPVWFSDRSAIYRAFELDQFTKPLGRYLMSFPSLLAFLTLSIFVVEWVAPLLILAGNNRARTVGCGLLMLFHLGIAATMDLEFFPLASLVALLGCLPSHLWRSGQAEEPASVPQWSVSTLTSGAVAVALGLILIWDGMLILNDRKPPSHDSKVASILSVFRLTQFWDLFSPVPRPVDSRYFVEAKLKSGERIDLLRGGQPLSSASVKYPYREFKDQLQRIYLTTLEWSLNDSFRERYLRRRMAHWQQQHPEQEIVWTRLWSARRETSFSDPVRRTQLFELARVQNPATEFEGPINPRAGAR